MTEHPLTDKMIQAISHNIHAYDDTRPFRADMRAAADWQLKQVIEWLKVNLMKHDFYEGYAYLVKTAWVDLYDDCSNAEIDVDKVLEDLKQAMRPQEDNFS
jgi:hypothetical protein